MFRNSKYKNELFSKYCNLSYQKQNHSSLNYFKSIVRFFFIPQSICYLLASKWISGIACSLSCLFWEWEGRNEHSQILLLIHVSTWYTMRYGDNHSRNKPTDMKWNRLSFKSYDKWAHGGSKRQPLKQSSTFLHIHVLHTKHPDAVVLFFLIIYLIYFVYIFFQVFFVS